MAESYFADEEITEVGDFPGLVERGNISLKNRPIVDMVDQEGRPGKGTIYSSARPLDLEDNRYVTYPTIYGGKQHSDDDAFTNYQATGRHLGITEGGRDVVNNYGKFLSRKQGQDYGM